MNRAPASTLRAETRPISANTKRLAEAIYLMMFSDELTRRRVTALADRLGLSRADLRAEVLLYVDRLADCRFGTGNVCMLHWKQNAASCAAEPAPSDEPVPADEPAPPR